MSIDHNMSAGISPRGVEAIYERGERVFVPVCFEGCVLVRSVAIFTPTPPLGHRKSLFLEVAVGLVGVRSMPTLRNLVRKQCGLGRSGRRWGCPLQFGSRLGRAAGRRRLGRGMRQNTTLVAMGTGVPMRRGSVSDSHFCVEAPW